MKKTLVALAALAATSAFAQSSVSITGVIDPSYTSTKTTYGNGASRTVTALKNGQQNTSNFTLKAVEDLGGGLKGMMLYEFDMDVTKGGSLTSQPDNKDQFQSGEVYAGLEGGFGTIKLGAPNTPSLSVQGARTPFGTKVGGGFGSTSGSSHVRENGSIVYATPVMAGFSVQYGFQPATAAQNSTNGTAAAKVEAKTDLGLFYANGPVAAGLSMYEQKGVNEQTNGYVSYTFGAAKVTYGFHNEEFKTTPTAATAPGVSLAAGKYSGNNVAGIYTVGSFDLMANSAKLNDKTSNNNDRKITAVGVRYNLSKRTNVYGRLVNDKLDNVTGATLNAKINTTVLGLAHNF